MKEQNGNGFAPSIAQAIEEMKAFQGDSFSLERINLAELERRTGVSRSRLRRLKKNSFQDLPRSTKGSKHTVTKLSGYTGLLDSLLRQGVKNSSVVLERLRQAGFEGGATIVKEYIAAHKHLIPAKRQLVAAQGNRGRRYVTKPGEAYQMDWGFTDVLDYNGQTYRVACFAMICHHCGQRYIEFFLNARQENLFIGMIHAFQYMGVPRFVKDNFLADRVFCDLTDLNWQALEWCNKQNGTYRRTVDGAPQKIHETICGEQLRMVPEDAVRFYLCPERKISFDGFVNYEGRRFGVPYSYPGATARVERSGDLLRIYSADLKVLLVTHTVTWSRTDSFCEGQYESLVQPEEFPTAPAQTQILQLPKSSQDLSFAKFDFDKEDQV